jgi:hypothetical protein
MKKGTVRVITVLVMAIALLAGCVACHNTKPAGNTDIQLLTAICQKSEIDVEHKSRAEPEVHLINYRTSEINPDGTIEELAWEEATTITHLHAPWTPEERNSTAFRCFISPGYFNFAFEVINKSPISLDYTHEKSVAKGDRVELFFSASTELSPYYRIEMNPHGHIFDDEAYFHHVFDDSWNFSHRTVVGKTTPKGYIIEGYIAIPELQSLGIDVNAGFYLGVFRADFTKEDENTATWYSWINPQVEEAKFHIPSAFRKSQQNQ